MKGTLVNLHKRLALSLVRSEEHTSELQSVPPILSSDLHFAARLRLIVQRNKKVRLVAAHERNTCELTQTISTQSGACRSFRPRRRTGITPCCRPASIPCRSAGESRESTWYIFGAKALPQRLSLRPVPQNPPGAVVSRLTTSMERMSSGRSMQARSAGRDRKRVA